MTGIRRCQGGPDSDIADLILSIQNNEAGLDLRLADQPDLLGIEHHYRAGGFWIAEDDDGSIVGTIGLQPYGRVGLLKKFFVAAPQRGRGGPAFSLLASLLDRAGELGLTDIVLDTPSVATRSHAFYVRNGFHRATAEDPPVISIRTATA